MAQVLKRVPAALLETLYPYSRKGFRGLVVYNEVPTGFTPKFTPFERENTPFLEKL